MSEKKNERLMLLGLVCVCCSIGLALASVFGIRLITYLFAIPSAIMLIGDTRSMIKRFIFHKPTMFNNKASEEFDKENPALSFTLSLSEIVCTLLLVINVFINSRFIGVTFGLLYLFTILYAIYVGMRIGLSDDN